MQLAYQLGILSISQLAVLVEFEVDALFRPFETFKLKAEESKL